MKHAGLVVLVCLLACTGAARAGDYASFSMRGYVEALNVVQVSGSGSVVQATLRLSVLDHGSNALSGLCARGGNAMDGWTVGPCEIETLFDDCVEEDVVSFVSPRDDGSGLNDSQTTCASSPGTCVEVSGYMLGTPQTNAMAVAVIDTVSLSADCTARSFAF